MNKDFAVVSINSKQFIIKKGSLLEVDSISNESKIEVLLAVIDGKTYIGEPVLDKFGVEIDHFQSKKDDKLVVRRFRNKSKYRKNKSHRQPISIVKIKDFGADVKNAINFDVQKPEKTEAEGENVTKVEKTKVKKVEKTTKKPVKSDSVKK